MDRHFGLKWVSLLLAILVLALVAGCGGQTSAPAPEPAAPAAQESAPVAEAPAPTAAVAATAPEPTQPPAEEPAPAGGPQAGGILIAGSPQEPATLNPLLSSQSIADAVAALTIEGLVEVDAEGKYAPVLAEALPEVSDDGLVVTYKLKEGVTFSNGDSFTCADVVYTWDAIMSDLSQASTAGYRNIDAIECPDDLTVEVTFGKLYAPYLRLFSYILPQAAGDPANLDNWEFNRNPIGTGPWVVKEWRAGDQLIYVPNPNYREAGKPYLDSVIVKILPSREVGMQLLGTGEIHALWDLIEADFPALDAMKSKGVGYAAAVTGENELLLFNFSDPAVDAPADPSANPHPILYDVRVREAIQMAIDKELIVETLLNGQVKAGTTVLPVGQFACPQPLSEYNPERAASILEEAGWTLGRDGVREKDGVKMSMKFQTTSGNKLREDTQQVLVEMLKAIGVDLRIENVPSDVLFAGWDSNGLRKHGNFDIIMYTTGPGIDPDSHLYGNYHSDNVPTVDNNGGGSNFSRWINADVDGWIDEAAGITDVAERQKLYCQVAEQINKDLPRAFLYERLLITGVRDEDRTSPSAPALTTSPPAPPTGGSRNRPILCYRAFADPRKPDGTGRAAQTGTVGDRPEHRSGDRPEHGVPHSPFPTKPLPVNH